MSILDIFKDIKEKYPNLCDRRGMPRIKNDKKLNVSYNHDGLHQFLYGDVCDWIRDYYTELSLEERDLLAHLIIGDFVIKNTLL